MRFMKTIVALAALSATPIALAGGDIPLGTAITYQGKLDSAGEPVNEPVDFKFRLYDDALDFDQVGVELSDLAFLRSDVGLAAEAGVDRHDQDLVDEVQHVVDGLERRGRVHRDGRSGAEVLDGVERAVEVAHRLHVNGDQIAAGIDVQGREEIGVLDHEMGLEPHVDPFAA